MHHRLWGMRVGRGPKLHHPPREARKVTECVQRIQNYAPMMSSSPSVGYWSGVFILSSGVLILSNENQGRGRANACKNSSLAGCSLVRCFGLSVIFGRAKVRGRFTALALLPATPPFGAVRRRPVGR